ncbi:MAG: 5-oxoprolinase subunit PxpA [Defluviitaleaceae bacterium]|nr:5-oxoprolinase subunit PxpA [Defluviitaleaceae bacterium]
MYQIDINSDLGESFGNYRLGYDDEILKHVTSANIACGYHAGDPVVMEKTVEMAVKNGVMVGAHPGLPDLLGFGRRAMAVSTEEVKAYVKYQIGAFWAFAKAKGQKIQHVKPHGALYNMAAVDYNIARAIADAIYEIDKTIIFLALANSEMTRAANDIGLKAANEVFADRAYNKDGTLVARGIKGAMIHDVEQCAKRVVKMVKDKTVICLTGEAINLEPHSICVHGDNPEAVEFVTAIKSALAAEGIHPTALKEIV